MYNTHPPPAPPATHTALHPHCPPPTPPATKPHIALLLPACAPAPVSARACASAPASAPAPAPHSLWPLASITPLCLAPLYATSLRLWAGDINGDGELDLLLVEVDSTDRPCTLYLNRGAGASPRFVKDATHLLATDPPGRGRKDARFADVDNDGDLDLIMTHQSSAARLYLNAGDGTYSRVSEEESAISTDARTGSMCAAWGDYNADGFVDLFIGRHAGYQDVLYRNDGHGGFVREFMGPGNPDTRSSFSFAAAWADVDGDGDADLFVGSTSSGGGTLWLNQGSTPLLTTFERSASFFEPAISYRPSSDMAIFGDYDGDGDLDLWYGSGAWGSESPNHFYQNLGHGRFVRELVNVPLVTRSVSTWGGAFADMDNDGDVDFLECGPELQFWENDAVGGGTFARETFGPIPNDKSDSEGGAWLDVDNDGHLDLVLITSQGNVLYRNGGTGAFEIDSLQLTEGGTCNHWNAINCNAATSHCCTCYLAAADYNSDGWTDLVIVSADGHNHLYRNDAGTLTRVTTGGVATDSHTSCGVAWADVDADGDLDLLVTNADAENDLYINTGGDDFVRLPGSVARGDVAQSGRPAFADLNGVRRQWSNGRMAPALNSPSRLQKP